MPYEGLYCSWCISIWYFRERWHMFLSCHVDWDSYQVLTGVKHKGLFSNSNCILTFSTHCFSWKCLNYVSYSKTKKRGKNPKKTKKKKGVRKEKKKKRNWLLKQKVLCLRSFCHELFCDKIWSKFWFLSSRKWSMTTSISCNILLSLMFCYML